MTLVTTEQSKTPPRRTIPLSKQDKPEPRHPGARQVWKRLRENQGRSNWDTMVKLGANESLGSQLGILYLEGHLNDIQADAGRFFARMCAAHDHYFNISRRDMVSPAYERGFSGSRDDEEQLAILQGTIKDYERRCKRIKNKWSRIETAVDNPTVLNLLLLVCVHDQPCPADKVKLFRAALEMIVRKFRLDAVRPEEVPRMRYKKRRRARNGGSSPGDQGRQAAPSASAVGHKETGSRG